MNTTDKITVKDIRRLVKKLRELNKCIYCGNLDLNKGCYSSNGPVCESCMKKEKNNG